MEILILICLIIIIILLLPEKVRFRRKQDTEKETKTSGPVKQELIEIMGKPRPLLRQEPPNTASERQSSQPVVKEDSFNTAIEKEGADDQIPQEEPVEVREAVQIDWVEEEEEWSMDMEPDDGGFAAGVSFEELDQASQLLDQESLSHEQEKQVTGTLLKVQGTDLFYQLENSLGSVSQKVRSLLDAHLAAQTDTSSSSIRNKDLEDFNIAAFT